MAATWTELANELKANIQELTTSGQWNVQSVTGLDGITHTFYSMAELVDFYNIVNSLSQAEEDTSAKPKYRPLAMRRSTFRR